jgi:hypothetical protein
VRAEILDPLRAARPSLSDDIAEQNFARVNAQGPDRLDAVLRDIRRDRDQTYETLTRATVSISVSGASSA